MNKKIANIFKKNNLKKLSGKDIFIIAEIGKNFIQTKKDRPVSEYLQNAKKLICLAKKAGADAVKFQTHNLADEQLNIRIASPHFIGSDRYNWVKRNEKATPLIFWKEIKKYCDKLEILFFSTPMSRGAAKKLEKVGVKIWKIGSADILDFPMLSFITKTQRPIIISSGMSTLREVDKAMAFLKNRTRNVAILHCVSKYPCLEKDLNLNTINFFKNRYSIPVGFSDHSLGYKSSVAAAQMGAIIIEKHFSLNRNLWGSDHKVSLTPFEFDKMVKMIRVGEKVKVRNYGKNRKIISSGEIAFRSIFRKSLVAGCNIKKGEILKEKMIYSMRPQRFCSGLHSEEYEKILGKKAKNNIKKYSPLSLNLFQ